MLTPNLHNLKRLLHAKDQRAALVSRQIDRQPLHVEADTDCALFAVRRRRDDQARAVVCANGGSHDLGNLCRVDKLGLVSRYHPLRAIFQRVTNDAKEIMKTALIPNVALRADDDRITAALKQCNFDGGGNTMVVGVRNEAGAIYRGITTLGMSDFMQVIGVLQKLGLSDELAQSTGMREKCDAIFS